MDKEKIFDVIRENILEILPELADKEISISDSLRDLGANSIDRAEILIQTLSKLQLKVALTEFGSAKDIDALASIMHAKLT